MKMVIRNSGNHSKRFETSREFEGDQRHIMLHKLRFEIHSHPVISMIECKMAIAHRALCIVYCVLCIVYCALMNGSMDAYLS
jgi:hypothetical protein